MEHAPTPGEQEFKRARHRSPETPEMRALELRVMVGIERAVEQRRMLDREALMAATELLILRHPDKDFPRLHEMLATGEIRNERARRDYLPIYLDPEVSAIDTELIDRIGTAIINIEAPFNGRPPQLPPGGHLRLADVLWETTVGEGQDALEVWVRGDLPQEAINRLPVKFSRYLETYGDAFRALLSLPDVDASNGDDAIETFENTYIGSYRLDREHVLEEVAELIEMRNEIEAIAEKYGLGETITIDLDLAWDIVTEHMFDIVEYGNDYHVFGK